MNPAVERMFERYPRDTLDQNVHALREILQQLALLGLWRSKFFEHAAFYGGTALRILYGLDRSSEDLDFSLLSPKPEFSLARYGSALREELAGFGFDVRFEGREKVGESAIESAFIKTNTLEQLIVVEVDHQLLSGFPAGRKLKIRLEVDVDPPPGFTTESATILQPVPFAVRVYSLPDLFAGKVHALLCRKWNRRVKGRDWYDFVWYVANHPRLHLNHLEQRMRQSGDLSTGAGLGADALRKLMRVAVEALDVDTARDDVAPFLFDPRSVEIWSAEFFRGLIDRVEMV